MTTDNMTTTGQDASTPTLEVANHSSGIFNVEEMGKRLFVASKAGKLEEVKQVVQLMINVGGGAGGGGVAGFVNMKNAKNWTALHFAAYLGRHEVAEYLLSVGGADVNAVCDKTSKRYKGGETSLHFAVDNCDIKMARLLLDYGADLSIQNLAHQTPLDAAASMNIISQVSSYWKQKQQRIMINNRNSLQTPTPHNINNQEEMIVPDICTTSSDFLAGSGDSSGGGGDSKSSDDDGLVYSNYEPSAKRMKIEEEKQLIKNQPIEATTTNNNLSSGKDLIEAKLLDFDIQIAKFSDNLCTDFASLREEEASSSSSSLTLECFQDKLSTMEANQKQNVEALREQLATITRELLDSN